MTTSPTVTAQAGAAVGKADANVTVSFVIPALNEASIIGRTLTSIHEAAAGRYGYEIIVVDNGSSDDTVRIAHTLGSRVIIDRARTVSALRNVGADIACGSVLVFLDADVVVTRAWGDHFPHTLSALGHKPNVIVGSWCGVPDAASWIERYWFSPLVTSRNSHINSGHLIIRKDEFMRIGGFDQGLDTGEDYELSMRAVLSGSTIEEDSRLAVIHHGYPKTAVAFVRRESWHGRSDFTNVQSIIRSRVAHATIVFILLHVTALYGVMSGRWPIALTALVVLAIQLAGLALRKYGTSSVLDLIVRSWLYYLYLLGRSIAIGYGITGVRGYVHRSAR